MELKTTGWGLSLRWQCSNIKVNVCIHIYVYVLNFCNLTMRVVTVLCCTEDWRCSMLFWRTARILIPGALRGKQHCWRFRTLAWMELWLAGKRMTWLAAWHKFHHQVSPLLPKRVHRPLKGTLAYKDMIAWVATETREIISWQPMHNLMPNPKVYKIARKKEKRKFFNQLA